MNVSFTIDGGLRLEVESPDDWSILRFLPYDAEHGGIGLVDRLGAPLDEPDARKDWEEFVADDLREMFDRQVITVHGHIEQAARAAEEGPGHLMITADNVEVWFATFNQARLALEARYQFHGAAKTESSERMFAYQRSQFYTAIQGLILDRLMRP